MRLGHVKALERLDNQSLIERTVERLSPPAQKVLVVTSQEQFGTIATSRLRTRIISDLYPGKGALGGIYTGLACTDSIYSLVVACDMPFLNRDLLRYLIDCSDDFDVVVPRLNGLLEPLHAVYSKRCLDPISKMLEQDGIPIYKLYDQVKTRYVGEDEIVKFDPEHLSFFNINTVTDLTRARQLIKHAKNSS